MFYIIVAVLIFGFLIATHELGHFIVAKIFNIKVNEFSIGMGPSILKKQKGETLYSIRAFPIGGFCAMEGEDDDSADPRAIDNVAGWKKFLVLCAGAVMNFVTGLLILIVLFSLTPGFYRPIISGFAEGFGLEDCALQKGDRVLRVDGHRIYSLNNVTVFLSRADDKVDWVVERDGVKLEFPEVYMPLRENGTDENGVPVYRRGITIGLESFPATPLVVMQQSIYTSIDYTRSVWLGLADLLRGAVGLSDLSGPLGIINTITEVGSNESISPTPQIAAYNIASLASLIAVNLAVINLLPLPALDGGRIFFLILNGLTYALFHKKIKPEYEGYVHLVGLGLLLLLMLFVTVSDVGKLFSGR